jgi:hypothetical protein
MSFFKSLVKKYACRNPANSMGQKTDSFVILKSKNSISGKSKSTFSFCRCLSYIALVNIQDIWISLD